MNLEAESGKGKVLVYQLRDVTGQTIHAHLLVVGPVPAYDDRHGSGPASLNPPGTKVRLKMDLLGNCTFLAQKIIATTVN